MHVLSYFYDISHNILLVPFWWINYDLKNANNKEIVMMLWLDIKPTNSNIIELHDQRREN